MANQEPIRKRGGGSSARSAGSSAGSPPQIPDKLYFRIGEVAALCDVPAYVLRFWEGEFPQLKPNKGGSGQRLYRRRDVEMALRIKSLLYDEGYTIPGARAAFKAELRTARDPQLGLGGIADQVDAKHLVALRKELQDLLNLLSKPAAPRAAVQAIRTPRSFAHARAEHPRTEPAAPRPFAKPQLLPVRRPADLLDSLFDTLPPESE
jgi:DNA-binding transcriptional MerR regulator